MEAKKRFDLVDRLIVPVHHCVNHCFETALESTRLVAKPLAKWSLAAIVFMALGYFGGRWDGLQTADATIEQRGGMAPETRQKAKEKVNEIIYQHKAAAGL